MERFRRGDRVVQVPHGPGIVIDTDARYTVIEFDDGGIRKFVTELVHLSRCDVPRPVAPPVRRAAGRGRAREAG